MRFNYRLILAATKSNFEGLKHRCFAIEQNVTHKVIKHENKFPVSQRWRQFSAVVMVEFITKRRFGACKRMDSSPTANETFLLWQDYFSPFFTRR